MEQVRRLPDFRRHRVVIGTGILVAIQLGMAIVLRQGGPTESSVLAVSGLAALGLFAIGALNVAHTPYPRWAYRSMVGILITGVLLSPWTATSPEAWAHQARGDLWLIPWYLMVLSSLPAAKAGRCAPNHPRVGLFLVGTSIVLAALSLLGTRVHFF